jgi:hypothetical protein
VTDYDVSLADGSVAYVANNQLILVNADGSNRQVLLDGGSRDENNFWVTSPVFSPDRQILAYGYKGLNLYDITTGISNLAIANQNGDLLPSGMPFPLETYSPVHYSPDGTKLLVALGHWESLPMHAVYDPGTNNAVWLAPLGYQMKWGP